MGLGSHGDRDRSARFPAPGAHAPAGNDGNAVLKSASLRGTGSAATWISIAAVFVLSLWLRRAFPITAFANAMHDDLLFVRLAEHLRDLQWLGPFDELTLAKGAAYPAFLALNQLTGVPLKMTEHVLYLLASLLFATTVGKVFRSRAATLVCFVPLALNPTLWAADVGGRVVREGLYIPLSLLLLALTMRAFVVKSADSFLEDVHAKRYWLAALGLAGAVFWLTREEGAWLVPSVLLLVAYGLVDAWRRMEAGQRSIHVAGVYLAIPAVGFFLMVGAVNAANYFAYGVFRNNDFRSQDFQAAYGALSRIRHDAWSRYIVFPKDARERAYAVSPAARELEPFLEGDGGKKWVGSSCVNTGGVHCREIHSGWFLWALREAVVSAGHYRSARAAQRYYLRLAGEVNDACDRGLIACGGRRDTVIPPWHASYLAETAAATSAIFRTLLSLGRDMKASVLPSIGSIAQIARFDRITNGTLATENFRGPADARFGIATGIAAAQVAANRVIVPLALVGWAGLLLAAAVHRRWHPGHAVVAALVTAIAMRVGLLGFLEATSIPSNNTLYLSPVIPMALALGPCVLFLLLVTLGGRRTQARATIGTA